MGLLRIVLADDHMVVRAGLKVLIDAQPDMEVVGEAADGATAITQAEAAQPDLIVIDLSMPGLNGLEATQQLRERLPTVHILVLSAHEDPTYVGRALEAGATGYVVKRAAAELLISAIRAVGSGSFYLDPTVGATLLQRLVGGSSAPPGTMTALSDREETVLRLIAQGYSNKQIGFQLELSVKTVESYKARAVEKLNLASRVDIVRYATERGWLSQP